MKYSVIIRFKNEERWIGHSIQSVIDLFPKNTDIVLVNNNSSDKSLEIVELFKNINTNTHKIKIINVEKYTPGLSINTALKYCDNENILILSSHCEIKKINFPKINNLLKDYCAIWGKQIPIYFGKKINRNRYIWKNFENNDSINYYSEGENRYFLHNALAIYKKNILLENPIDEKLIGKEDRYWAIDMINKGNKIYYDSELVCHHHYTVNGATWKSI
mgnify:CR=1 FL=1